MIQHARVRPSSRAIASEVPGSETREAVALFAGRSREVGIDRKTTAMPRYIRGDESATWCGSRLVELRGFEPLTSSMPLTRSPN